MTLTFQYLKTPEMIKFDLLSQSRAKSAVIARSHYIIHSQAHYQLKISLSQPLLFVKKTPQKSLKFIMIILSHFLVMTF